MRCDSATDGIVRMREDMTEKCPVESDAFDRFFLNPNHISDWRIMQIVSSQKKSTVIYVSTLVGTALLSAVAFLLAFLEIRIPLSPEFARMDFSDFPALMAAFAFGPWWGVAVEFIKNALQLISTQTGGIGELANFCMGAAFVFIAGIIYKKNKSKKGAVLSCVFGSIAMAVVAGLLNYFVLLPMYEQFMPLDQVIASFGAFIPFIKTKLDVVLFNCIPFNLLKGIVISVVCVVLYRYIEPLLLKRSRGENHDDSAKVS